MLIHKDLKGDAGGPEHQALKGMLDVGNTFMTDRRDGSEVQRSGEFVTMRRTGGEVVQLVSLWEPPDARRLTDGYAQAVPDDVAPPARARPTQYPGCSSWRLRSTSSRGRCPSATWPLPSCRPACRASPVWKPAWRRPTMPPRTASGGCSPWATARCCWCARSRRPATRGISRG